MSEPEEVSDSKPVESAWWRNEDWLAVILGFLIIALVLASLRPELPDFKWATGDDLLGKIFAAGNLWKSAKIGIILLVITSIGIVLLRGSLTKYVIGFPIVFALSWVAQVLAGSATMNYWGIEYVIFALFMGLLISNTVGVPKWLEEAVKTEYYIKTGLVILGTSLLFQEILKAGLWGIVQALLVVVVVWYVAF